MNPRPAWFLPVLLLWSLLLFPVGTFAPFAVFLIDSPGPEAIAWIILLAWLALPISFAAGPIGMWVFQKRGNVAVMRRFALLPLVHALALVALFALGSTL